MLAIMKQISTSSTASVLLDTSCISRIRGESIREPPWMWASATPSIRRSRTRATCSSPFRRSLRSRPGTGLRRSRRRLSRSGDGEPVQRDSRGRERTRPMGAPSTRPTRTTCSLVSESRGIRSAQAGCSCAPATACISTRRRSACSPRTCRAPYYDPFRTDRSISNAPLSDPAARHGERALRGVHASGARDQRTVRGASMAALEHRRPAAPVLQRHDRCRLRGLPRRSSRSIREHQSAAAGGPGRATRVGQPRAPVSRATTRSSCAKRRPGVAIMVSWSAFVTRLAVPGRRA